MDFGVPENKKVLVSFSDWWLFNYKLADACSQISCLLYSVLQKQKYYPNQRTACFAEFAQRLLTS